MKIQGQARADMTTDIVVPEPKARLDKVKPEAKEVRDGYCCTRHVLVVSSYLLYI